MTNYIQETELETSIKKIEMYKNSLNILLDEITKTLDQLNYEFRTNNTKTFQDFQTELVNKGNTFNNVFNNNLYVLRKNLEMYKTISQEVANSFNNLI